MTTENIDDAASGGVNPPYQPFRAFTDCLVIGLDVDGVFADFVNAYVDRLEMQTGKVIPRVPPKWHWLDDHLTPEEMKFGWDTVVGDPYFWADLQPLPSAVDTLLTLDSMGGDHHIYFLTNRPRGAKYYTEHWLTTHGFASPTVLLAKDKGPIAKALDFDIYLDDNADNIAAVRDALPSTSRVYMLDTSYNQGVDIDGVTRLASLDQLFTTHERLF